MKNTNTTSPLGRYPTQFHVHLENQFYRPRTMLVYGLSGSALIMPTPRRWNVQYMLAWASDAA